MTYALEGSIFVGGAIVQWLRDGLGIIRSSGEVETLAHSVPDAGGVYFVPALTGLAAPYWNQDVRGAISGISRGTTAAHIARAALEGIAFQTMDVVNAMIRDAGIELKELTEDWYTRKREWIRRSRKLRCQPTKRPFRWFLMHCIIQRVEQ